MSEIEDALKRIDHRLAKKPIFFTIVVSVFVPIVIAIITAYVSVYTLQQTAKQSAVESNLKKVEVVSTIVKDFSAQDPEQTVLLMSIIKSAKILDSDTAKDVEEYALSLTRKKINRAIATGGEEAAQSIENTVAVIQAANTPGANKLSAEIENKEFYVIAASDTTKKLAKAFKNQLLDAGFSDAQVLRYSNQYAVSVAYLPYAEALKVKNEFEAKDRFHHDYPNTAYIQIKKKDWEIID